MCSVLNFISFPQEVEKEGSGVYLGLIYIIYINMG